MASRTSKFTRPSVTTWARTVTSEQRHDLRELEDRVRAQAPAGKIGVLTMIGIFAMIVGTTIYFSGDSGRYQFDVDVEAELFVTAICFPLVCIFQGNVFVNWWRNGRVRDVSAMYASGFAALTGGYVTWMASSRVDPQYTPLLAALVIGVPALAALAGVGGFFTSLLSRRPSQWRAGWNSPPTATISTLRGERKDSLMADRGEALRILVDRDLLDLDDAEIQRLSDMPLGQLGA